MSHKRASEQEHDGGVLDFRRKAAITRGGPTDHAGDAVVAPNSDFNIDMTIFRTLTGVARYVMNKDLAVTPYWKESATQRISVAFAPIERPLSIDKDLKDFMHNDCNFSMVHADGSFMDHLTFCHDYSAENFSAHSPRVLLLHSILGVGTNYFPMKAEKIPKLAELLTPQEMTHVEAFPSVLRLLMCWDLLNELNENIHRLDKLGSIKFFRVIDNKEIELSVEDLWVQLNYQMIHLLDFIPTVNWQEHKSTPIFQVCLGLYEFLCRAGQLRARVEMDAFEPSGVRVAIKRRLAIKAVRKYSAEIGHALSYGLSWDDN